jgi:hypothetical protein
LSELAPHDVEASSSAPARARGLAVGTTVCVWNRFLDRWSGGFEIAEVLSSGYRLRRLSDGQVLDDPFSFEDVLTERRNNPMRGTDGSFLDRKNRYPGSSD